MGCVDVPETPIRPACANCQRRRCEPRRSRNWHCRLVRRRDTAIAQSVLSWSHDGCQRTGGRDDAALRPVHYLRPRDGYFHSSPFPATGPIPYPANFASSSRSGDMLRLTTVIPGVFILLDWLWIIRQLFLSELNGNGYAKGCAGSVLNIHR